MEMSRFTIVGLVIDNDVVSADTPNEVIEFLRDLENDDFDYDLADWMVSEWSGDVKDVFIASYRADKWLKMNSEGE